MNAGKLFSIKETTAMPTEAEVPLSLLRADLPITNKNDLYVMTGWEALGYYIWMETCHIYSDSQLMASLKCQFHKPRMCNNAPLLGKQFYDWEHPSWRYNP
jgi:hypothetical protein